MRTYGNSLLFIPTNFISTNFENFRGVRVTWFYFNQFVKPGPRSIIQPRTLPLHVDRPSPCTPRTVAFDRLRQASRKHQDKHKLDQQTKQMGNNLHDRKRVSPDDPDSRQPLPE